MNCSGGLSASNFLVSTAEPVSPMVRLRGVHPRPSNSRAHDAAQSLGDSPSVGLDRRRGSRASGRLESWGLFCICLWGPDILTVTQLEQALLPAKGTMVLVMGQCHGGFFGALAGACTVVLSACQECESSWACPSPPGLAYDEFLYQFGTALFGAPSDAPQAGPARRPLSLLDAFHWASRTRPAAYAPNEGDSDDLRPGWHCRRDLHVTPERRLPVV